MAIPFLNNITLNNNEVQNVKLHNTGSAPNAAGGQIYFDTSDNLAKYYSNAIDLWIDLKEYSFSNGTYIDATTTGTTAKPVLKLDISAVDGTASAGERYLTKNNTWAEVAAIPGTYTWTVAGDTGSEAVPSGDTITFVGGTGISTSYNSTSNELTISTSGVMTGFTVAGDTGTNQTISNGDTLTISGGAVIVTTGIATDELVVKHDVVTNTPTTSSASPAHGGTFTAIDSITVSSEGHVTGVNTKTVTLPADNNDNTTYDLSVQSGGSNDAVIRLSGSDSTNDDVKVEGTSTTIKVTENATPNTITLDLQDDVTIVNDLTVGGDINVTGSLNSYTTSELLVQDQYITLNSGQTSGVLDAFVKVERGTTDVALKWNESTDRWQFTNDGSTYYNIPISTEYNNYTHPTHPGDDIDVDTGALTGATVVSDIDINITTDTLGHVTDANGVVSTRTLTLGDLGYTGATDADNYGSWTIQDGDTTTYTITSGDTLQIASGGGITSNFTADDVLTISHNDTSSASSVNNSGLTVIQDLTIDTYGHVTAIGSADITSSVTSVVTGREYVTTITDTATVTHSLGSRDVMVQLYDVTTYETVYADVERTTTSAVDITFASTPTNSIRVLITKIG